MNSINKGREKLWVFSFFILAGGIAATITRPIAQDTDYHLFADSRNLFSIPNFWNVISNLLFLVIGATGIVFVSITNKRHKSDRLLLNNFIFFTGIFFTGIGSAYYHLNPSNESLVWDRLPMSISFMSFFSIIIGRFISVKDGKLFLFPLLAVGLTSVIYWYITERSGCGDLRLYILIQFLPMLLIPMIMLFSKSKYDPKYLWFVLLAYVIAKIFETFDGAVFECGNLISGHSVKHLVAALAPVIFLLDLRQHRIN